VNKNIFLKTRLWLTGIVTIAIWSLLIWNHYHGGVPSHHILARKDLPEISNWWGGLLLPLLTWLLLYRIQKRLLLNSVDKSATLMLPVNNILFGFAGALLFGILLAAFFTFGYADIPGYMLIGLLLLALFFPIYRAECLLGFVIGMTFTFGAVLPTGVGSLLALTGAVLYLAVRPVILYVTSGMVRILSSNKHKPGSKIKLKE
jgi:hypothetical protein